MPANLREAKEPTPGRQPQSQLRPTLAAVPPSASERRWRDVGSCLQPLACATFLEDFCKLSFTCKLRQHGHTAWSSAHQKMLAIHFDDGEESLLPERDAFAQAESFRCQLQLPSRLHPPPRFHQRLAARGIRSGQHLPHLPLALSGKRRY